MSDFKDFLSKVISPPGLSIAEVRENVIVTFSLDYQNGNFDTLIFLDKKVLGFDENQFSFCLFEILGFHQSLLFQNPKGFQSLVENRYKVEEEIQEAYKWLKRNPSGFVYLRLKSNPGKDLPLKGLFTFYYFADQINELPLEEDEYMNIRKTVFN